VLKCVAVCCSVFQCAAVRCSMQSVAVCCSVLQFVAVSCSVLQRVSVGCTGLQWVAVRGWSQTNFVELWSVSRPRLAEMAIEIWLMCQLTEKLFETSSVR